MRKSRKRKEQPASSHIFCAPAVMLIHDECGAKSIKYVMDTTNGNARTTLATITVQIPIPLPEWSDDDRLNDMRNVCGFGVIPSEVDTSLTGTFT